MDSITNKNDNTKTVFNSEIFTDIKDLFTRGGQLIDSGYSMFQSLDENLNDCLYMYKKEAGNNVNIIFLYKNDDKTKRMNNSNWKKKQANDLLNDFINIWALIEATDLDELKRNNPEINLLKYFKSLLKGFEVQIEHQD